MSQATFDDDELFDEASDDLRTKIEEAVTDAETALPSVETVWEPDGDNLLGQLNGVKAALEMGEARDRAREAKKWLQVAKRSGAIDEDDDLVDRVESVWAAIELAAAVESDVTSLTASLPELRQTLESS